MAIIVVYGGGFQPFHEGHLSSYLQAKKVFPDAAFFVAASNDVKQRPIPFKDKQFLAQQAGVVDPMVETKNPMNPQEILNQYDPDKDVFVMVRSERDPVPYIKKDGTPAYYQPYVKGQPLAPYKEHGYVFLTKKHNFTINGEKVYSGSQVRDMYGSADDAGRMKIVQQLYPKSKQQQMIKKLLDKYLSSPQEPAVLPAKTSAISKLKNKQLAEQIRKIRPLLKEATPATKLKFMKLMRTAIIESKETDYSDPAWDEKVQSVGQKAKQAEVLKSKGKEPRTRWNPVTKKYYVDFSDGDKDVAEAVEEEPGPQHRIAVKVTDPNTYSDVQKIVRVDATDKQDALDQVEAFYAKKGIYIVNIQYLGMVGQQVMAEGSEQISEYRDRLLQYVKSLLPNYPEYVLKDWLVPNKGNFSNLPDTELKNGIMEKLKGAGLTPNTKWQLIPNMQFTMDMFEPMSKQRLIGRAGGNNDMGLDVPRDKERHATQAALAQQQGGVRKEPVLLVKTTNGYELLEGWHRTIQHFAKYPEGYTGPAYVAVAQGQQGVAEGLSKHDQQDIDAIKAAIASLEVRLKQPNADTEYKEYIQQHIDHEKKRLALYGQGLAEGNIPESTDYLEEK